MNTVFVRVDGFDFAIDSSIAPFHLQTRADPMVLPYPYLRTAQSQNSLQLLFPNHRVFSFDLF